MCGRVFGQSRQPVQRPRGRRSLEQLKNRKKIVIEPRVRGGVEGQEAGAGSCKGCRDHFG